MVRPAAQRADPLSSSIESLAFPSTARWMRKELINLAFGHLGRMALAVEADVAADAPDVAALGAARVA